MEEVKYRVKIHLESSDYKLLDESVKNMCKNIIEENLLLRGPIPIPTKKIKFVTRRSPNIYKISFEKYEYKLHKRVIYIINVNNLDKLKFLGKVVIPQIIGIKINFTKQQKKAD